MLCLKKPSPRGGFLILKIVSPNRYVPITKFFKKQWGSSLCKKKTDVANWNSTSVRHTINQLHSKNL